MRINGLKQRVNLLFHTKVMMMMMRRRIDVCIVWFSVYFNE